MYKQIPSIQQDVWPIDLEDGSQGQYYSIWPSTLKMMVKVAVIQYAQWTLGITVKVSVTNMAYQPWG